MIQSTKAKNIKAEQKDASARTLNAKKVAADLIDAVEKLRLCEAIYGYISDVSCRVVCIANELSNEQRDSVWEVVWDFREKYPSTDIDVLLIQRHGRQLSE